MKRRRIKGFTLTELLVSIVIAGFLATIALLAAPSVIRLANQVEAKAEMGEMAADIIEFRQKEGRFPKDELPNVAPEGVSSFKEKKKGKKTGKDEPTGYDYNHHCLPMRIDDKIVKVRVIRITWTGVDGKREHNHENAIIEDDIGDDVVITVSAFELCDR